MKIQEVTLRAMAKRITSSRATEIIGISDAADAKTASGLEGIIVFWTAPTI